MSKIFLGEDAIFFKPVTLALAQPNFYVTQSYSVGVTSASVSQGSGTDTLLQKGTTFYLDNKRHTTLNQETISSGLITALEFTPATAMALPRVTVDSTDVNLGTDTFTYTAHGFRHGQLVQVISFGTVTGLATGTNYRISKVSNDEFRLLSGGSVVAIGGTADDVVVASVLILASTFQTIDLPDYCREPKPEFFIEQSHSFEHSQSEIITTGEAGYWLKWSYKFNLTTEAELSKFELFLNYANNPKNELYLVPNSASPHYIYRVVLTNTKVEDFYNHSSFSIEISAKYLEKTFPHYANNNYIVRKQVFKGV